MHGHGLHFVGNGHSIISSLYSSFYWWWQGPPFSCCIRIANLNTRCSQEMMRHVIQLCFISLTLEMCLYQVFMPRLQ